MIAPLALINLAALSVAYVLGGWPAVGGLLLIELVVTSVLAIVFVRGIATAEERP